MLYLLSILFCVIIIALLNILFLPQTLGFAFWQIIIWSAVATISVIVIDGLMATLIRWICPQKWFVFGKKIFVAKKKECFFYEKLGIKKWKDKVLELGQFTSFRKNKISDPTNNEYIERYILEANYGVGCHWAGIIFGFLAIFACPSQLYLTIGLPVCLVNVFYNYLSIAILRYNLPKLYVLHKFNAKRICKQADMPKSS